MWLPRKTTLQARSSPYATDWPSPVLSITASETLWFWHPRFIWGSTRIHFGNKAENCAREAKASWFEMADGAVPEAPDSPVRPWTNFRKISVGHFKVNLAQFSVCFKRCTMSCGDRRRWLRCSTKGSSVGHGKWPKVGMFSAVWNWTRLPCVSVSQSPSVPCVLSKFCPLGHYRGVLQSAFWYEQHPICLHSSGFLKSPTKTKCSQQLLM